ncbi:MAG: Ig-like domain-containing protein [Chitinophagaceae bacterium]|nr:Ig-like domain-containing protein [Chitinophagaceae bacterium]
MKKRKLLFTTAIAVLSLTAFLGSCKKDDFVQVDGVCPLVLSTDPAAGATSVALNKVITVTFNEIMNPATITQATFTITGATPVVGTITYSGNTATFTPSTPLTVNTTYTGRITTAVKDENGNALQTDYVWTFSTGATLAPVVIATDPLNNATGVPLNKTITATFNMPMDMLTINGTTFTVRQGTTAVAGVVTYNGTTAYFTPALPLTLNTVYTATITTGAKNTAGTPLAGNYVWTFTTGTLTAPTVISTDPVNNATSVVLNKVISATFSEPMNPLTLNATSFTLMQGTIIVPGTVTYSGSTAFFTPTISLLPGTLYTATITTGARNVAGTQLANNYVWTFTTGTAVAPAVISTDPVNNATGVTLNKTVTATFNMVMDPLTVNATTFTVKQGATTVLGTVTYSGSTASFNSTLPFTANTVYTATITTGAKNVAGTPLANNYVWTFTTGTSVAPTVILTDPASNAVNVTLSKIITATFSMPMDPLTINFTTFSLNNGVIPVAGVVTYTGSTASFTPAVALLINTTYTATITTGARNVAGTPLAANYVWSFTTGTTPVQGPVILNTAARFGILSGVGVSNQAGPSVINDLDVGIYPGVRSSVTGFPPATIVNGAIYASDDIAPPGVPAMLLQAKTDLTNAYLAAEAAVSPAPQTVSGDQGGLTLAPGIYKSTSTLSIANGNLTLDAQGNSNAIWIFQIASGFTTVGGAGGSVILTGGAQAKNIYWQTGSSATIGDYTSFQGNILALTSITMNSHATAVGRMLARNGAIVMTSTNIIIKP